MSKTTLQCDVDPSTKMANMKLPDCWLNMEQHHNSWISVRKCSTSVCGFFWTHDSEVTDRKWCFYDFKALDGGTALTYAVSCKLKEMAEFLIQNGANINPTCANCSDA